MKTRNLSILIALSCIGASAAANYDLLGRKGSQMNSPMVYKNVNYKAPKGSLEESVLAKQGLDSDVRGIAGIFEGYYYDMLKSYPFTFLIYKKNKTDMITSLTQYTTNFTPVYTSSKEAPKNLYTQVPSSGSTFNWSHVDLLNSGNVYQGYDNTIYYSTDFWRKKQQQNGYSLKASNEPISIDLETNGQPVTGPNKNSTYSYSTATSSKCGTETGKDAFNATLWTYTLRSFNAGNIPHIRVKSCGQAQTKEPELVYPQILVGLHLLEDDLTPPKTTYSNESKTLDNYIYNYHTVEIVSAGTKGIGSAGYVPEANAINAITVGSVSKGKYINEESPSDNPIYQANKPEIYSTTTLFPSLLPYEARTEKYEPGLKGRDGAAINTAAAVADLLRAEPFFRWHPELVKARLLTASSTKTNNHRKNNKYETILEYAKLFDAVRPSSESQGAGRYKHYSRFWNGESNVLLTSKVDGYSAVKFTEYVAKNHRYRAAIAWLTPGDDIANSKTTIPQDFDLELFWNNNLGANTLYSTDGTRTPFSYFTSNGTLNNSTSITNSTSGNNPYELVEFTADRDGYVTFVIKQFRDNEKCGSAKCKGYGKMQLGFDLIDIEGK